MQNAIKYKRQKKERKKNRKTDRKKERKGRKNKKKIEINDGFMTVQECIGLILVRHVLCALLMLCKNVFDSWVFFGFFGFFFEWVISLHVFIFIFLKFRIPKIVTKEISSVVICMCELSCWTNLNCKY